MEIGALAVPSAPRAEALTHDHVDCRCPVRAAPARTPHFESTPKDPCARCLPSASLRPRAGCRCHRLAVWICPPCVLCRSRRSAHRLAGGKSVPIRGRVSRRGMGSPGLLVSLDWRLVLAGNWARLVVFHDWGHLRPYPPDRQRGKLCPLQFPDDLLGRFHRGLAARAAVSLLSVGRISEAGPDPTAAGRLS